MNKIVDLIINEINSLDKKDLIISIDGRCGSGKSTLSKLISKRIDCNTFHLDDFFLRPTQRSEERVNTPGENVDHERFLNEILIPLSNKKDVIYRAYDCLIQKISKGYKIKYKNINIIEGVYCNHPNLTKYYGYKIFLDVNSLEQIKRIENRNGTDNLKMFIDKWIPLEEKYFACYNIQNICNLYVNTTKIK